MQNSIDFYIDQAQSRSTNTPLSTAQLNAIKSFFSSGDGVNIVDKVNGLSASVEGKSTLIPYNGYNGSVSNGSVAVAETLVNPDAYTLGQTPVGQYLTDDAEDIVSAINTALEDSSLPTLAPTQEWTAVEGLWRAASENAVSEAEMIGAPYVDAGAPSDSILQQNELPQAIALGKNVGDISAYDLSQLSSNDQMSLLAEQSAEQSNIITNMIDDDGYITLPNASGTPTRIALSDFTGTPPTLSNGSIDFNAVEQDLQVPDTNLGGTTAWSKIQQVESFVEESIAAEDVTFGSVGGAGEAAALAPELLSLGTVGAATYTFAAALNLGTALQQQQAGNTNGAISTLQQFWGTDALDAGSNVWSSVQATGSNLMSVFAAAGTGASPFTSSSSLNLGQNTFSYSGTQQSMSLTDYGIGNQAASVYQLNSGTTSTLSTEGSTLQLTSTQLSTISSDGTGGVDISVSPSALTGLGQSLDASIGGVQVMQGGNTITTLLPNVTIVDTSGALSLTASPASGVTQDVTLGADGSFSGTLQSTLPSSSFALQEGSSSPWGYGDVTGLSVDGVSWNPATTLFGSYVSEATTTVNNNDYASVQTSEQSLIATDDAAIASGNYAVLDDGDANFDAVLSGIEADTSADEAIETATQADLSSGADITDNYTTTYDGDTGGIGGTDDNSGGGEVGDGSGGDGSIGDGDGSTGDGSVSDGDGSYGDGDGGDPLVFSADGKGINLITYGQSQASYNFTGTGTDTHTGWVGAGTDMLVRQTSSGVTLPVFSDLSALDTNHDGVINSSDTNFSQLMAWNDANGNGVVDAGELQTLSQVGIASISLTTSAATINVGGSKVTAEGKLTFTNGTTEAIDQVTLSTQNMLNLTAQNADALKVIERIASGADAALKGTANTGAVAMGNILTMLNTDEAHINSTLTVAKPTITETNITGPGASGTVSMPLSPDYINLTQVTYRLDQYGAHSNQINATWTNVQALDVELYPSEIGSFESQIISQLQLTDQDIAAAATSQELADNTAFYADTTGALVGSNDDNTAITNAAASEVLWQTAFNDMMQTSNNFYEAYAVYVGSDIDQVTNITNQLGATTIAQALSEATAAQTAANGQSSPTLGLGTAFIGADFATTQDAVQAAYASAASRDIGQAFASADTEFTDLEKSVAQAWGRSNMVLLSSNGAPQYLTASGNSLIVLDGVDPGPSSLSATQITDSNTANTYIIPTNSNVVITNFLAGSGGSILNFVGAGTSVGYISDIPNGIVIHVGVNTTVTLLNIVGGPLSLTENFAGLSSIYLGATDQSQYFTPGDDADSGSVQMRGAYSLTGVSAANAIRLAGQTFGVAVTVSTGDTAADVLALRGLWGSGQLSAINGASVTLSTADIGFADIMVASSIVIQDAAANIVANLDALQSLSTKGSLRTIAFTDASTPNITVTATQATNDATVINMIAGAFYLTTLNPTGGVASKVLHATNIDISSVSLSGIQTLIAGGSVELTAAEFSALSITGNSAVSPIPTLVASAAGTYNLEGKTAAVFNMSAAVSGVTLTSNYTTGETLTTSSAGGDTINAEAAGDLVNALDAGGDSIGGHNNIIITVGENGQSGTDDNIYISSAQINVVDGSHVDVWGANNYVSAGSSDTLGVQSGNNNTIYAGEYTTIYVNNGTGDIINGVVDSVIVGASVSLTINGFDEVITGSNNATMTIYYEGGQAGQTDDVISMQGTGETILSHGGDNDYKLSSNFSGETINNDVTGIGSLANGEVDFSGVNVGQLWFKQSSNNLIIQKLGTSNTITIVGWFTSDAAAQVAKFVFGNGESLTNIQITQLVAAMAAYQTANPTFSSATATSVPNLQYTQTNADGSHVTTTYDLASGSWADGVYNYNSSGKLVTETTYNIDGSYDVTSYDLVGQAWTDGVYHYNASGQLASETTYNTDGSYFFTDYDLTGGSWIDGVYIYNASGQLASETTYNTDGSHSFTNYNLGGGSWVDGVYIYNSSGQLVNLTVNNTDGSYSFTNYDVTGGAWSSAVYIYNSSGQLVNETLTDNDGSSFFTNYNVAGGAGAWTYAFYAYNTTGQLITETVYYANGNEIITAGTPNATLTGGSGYTNYQFGSGFGQDYIANNGGNSPKGEVDFSSATSDEKLWFKQVGSDLEIDLLGTTDKITINSWFGSSAGAQVQSFDITGGLKLDSQVAQLVSAMATYSAAHSSFNPATATTMPTDTTLQSAITAAWHS